MGLLLSTGPSKVRIHPPHVGCSLLSPGRLHSAMGSGCCLHLFMLLLWDMQNFHAFFLANSVQSQSLKIKSSWWFVSIILPLILEERNGINNSINTYWENVIKYIAVRGPYLFISFLSYSFSNHLFLSYKYISSLWSEKTDNSSYTYWGVTMCYLCKNCLCDVLYKLYNSNFFKEDI